MPSERSELARGLYDAYAANDPSRMRPHLTTDFRSHAPPDPNLDIDGFFKKCWPAERWIDTFDLVRTIESGDEVVVTYEAQRVDGTRFRNTEVLTFRERQVSEIEVYFGWEL